MCFRSPSQKQARPSSSKLVFLERFCVLLVIAIAFLGLQKSTRLRRFPQHKEFQYASSNDAPTGTIEKKGNLNWAKDLIQKPVLLEVGGVVVFQLLGVPVISQFATVLRRLPRATRLARVSTSRGFRPFMYISKKAVNKGASSIKSIPNLFRRLKRTVATVYRRRSRLSVASDFTHHIDYNEDRTTEKEK